jgi:hypothetical protein
MKIPSAIRHDSVLSSPELRPRRFPVSGVESTGGNFIDTFRRVCVHPDQRTGLFSCTTSRYVIPFDRTRVTFVGRPLSAPPELFGVVELTHR